MLAVMVVGPTHVACQSYFILMVRTLSANSRISGTPTWDVILRGSWGLYLLIYQRIKIKELRTRRLNNLHGNFILHYIARAWQTMPQNC